MQFLSVHNNHCYLIHSAQKPGTAAIETVTLQVLSRVFKNHLTVFGESCSPPGDEQRTGLLHKPLLLQADGSNPEMREAAESADLCIEISETPTAAPEPRFANEIAGDGGWTGPFQELKMSLSRVVVGQAAHW